MDDAGAGAACQYGGWHLHPALLPVLGDRRATGRQIRQGDARPPGQGAGNGDHGRRRRRFLPAQPAGPDGRAVPARLPFDAVRAGQVRDHPAASARRRTGRWQCADRGWYLRRHPDRHAGRRAARRFGRASGLDCGRRLRRRGGRLPDQPRHSGRAGTGAGTQGQSQPVQRNLAQHRFRPAEPHGFPVHSRHLVVLALRRAVPRPVSGLRQVRVGRRRVGGDAAARNLHGRHRHRFDALRADVRQACRNRPGALWLDRPDAVRAGPLLRLAGRDGRHNPARTARAAQHPGRLARAT